MEWKDRLYWARYNGIRWIAQVICLPVTLCVLGFYITFGVVTLPFRKDFWNGAETVEWPTDLF